MSTQISERIPQWSRGDRLRKARTLTGLSTREFAERVGISPKSVNNYEGDAVEPRKIVMNAWALATGVPVEWLETGTAPTGTDGPDGGHVLPRLDSNQQPSGYVSRQVSGLSLVA